MNEEIKLECRYSNYFDCKMKTGTFESILTSHEKECQACSNCQYLCRVKACGCGLYYCSNELQAHIEKVKNIEPKADDARVKLLQAHDEALRQEEEEDIQVE